MKLESFIAVRYLFTGRQKSVVTVISWISLIGLLISTAALIVVLSVYNGIGEITKGLFNTFDPELLIEPSEGKTFHTGDFDYNGLCETAGVEQVSQMVSETAWITYGDHQSIVTLRGVDDDYRSITGLDTFLHEGEYKLMIGEASALIMGGEVFYDMGIRLHSNIPVAVYIPRRGTTSMGVTMDEAFNVGYAYPVANFFIQQDIDRRYVVTNIDFVRSLMDYSSDECTALAIKLQRGVNPDKAKKMINLALGDYGKRVTIKNRFDQQPLYFKIFSTERLGIYIILSLIILISTLSLVASLSLLVINKSRDIFILKSMGMTKQKIRHTFIAEGILICAVAVIAGLLIGFVICYLQQRFGIVRMGDGNFVVSAFPVAMRAVDFISTFLLVMVISTSCVILTVRRAKLEN